MKLDQYITKADIQRALNAFVGYTGVKANLNLQLLIVDLNRGSLFPRIRQWRGDKGNFEYRIYKHTLDAIDTELRVRQKRLSKHSRSLTYHPHGNALFRDLLKVAFAMKYPKRKQK